MEKFHAIVVGGGPVGCFSALYLAFLHFDVAIIDSVESIHTTNVTDARSIFLSYGSGLLFDRIGGFWGQKVNYLKYIDVFLRKKYGRLYCSATELDVAVLGHVVGYDRLWYSLREKVRQTEGITFFCPARILSQNVSDDEVSCCIQFHDERIDITASFIIVANGLIPTEAGVKKSFEQSMIMGFIDFDELYDARVQETGFECVHAEGAIACLPRLDRSPKTFSFIGHEKVVAGDRHLASSSLERIFQDTLGWRIGHVKKVHSVSHLAVQSQKRCTTAAALRTIYFGSARFSFHPVFAQSLNIALQEVSVFLHLLQKNQPFEKTDLRALIEQYECIVNNNHKNALWNLTNMVGTPIWENHNILYHSLSPIIFLLDHSGAIKHRIMKKFILS